MGNPGFDAVLYLISHKMSFFQFPDLEGQVCFDELESPGISPGKGIDFAHLGSF